MKQEEKTIAEQVQICKATIQQFIDNSHLITVRCIGSLRTIFKHQKYIIEVLINNTPSIRCFKRYNQFEALFQLIKMKYKNKQIKQFPSKFQLFGREETRKQYFENFLNQLIKDHDYNKRLLSIVYLFLTKGIKGISDDKYKQQLNNSQLLSRINKAQTQFDNNLNSPRKLSANTQLQKQNQIHQLENQSRINSSETSQIPLISSNQSNKNNVNEFQVKFENQDQWRIRYIKIEGSQLILFKHKLDNNFRTKIQLYRIHVQYLKRAMNFFEHFCQKMELPIKSVFKENPQILSIFHDYDCQKILIRRVNVQNNEKKQLLLQKLKQTIQGASKIPPINLSYDSVFHPIGKLFIVLKKLTLDWKDINQDEIIVIKIVTSSFIYESKQMVYRQQLLIKQGFLIPVSSAFQKIYVQCLVRKDLGWIRQGKQERVIGSYTIQMVDLITSPRACYHQDISMQTYEEQQKLQLKKKKTYNQTTILSITVENFSHFSSVYSDSFANQNDGKIVHTITLDDISQLSITLDRVLRVFGHVALFIQAFWRNVYLFKYPRLGRIFWTFLFFNLLLTDPSKTLFMVIVLLLAIIVYHHPQIRIYIDEVLDKYIYVIHPKFKNPRILSKSEVTFLKWSNHIKYIQEDYKIVKSQMGTYKTVKKSQKARTIWKFTRHQNQFCVREQQQSFLQKMMEIKKIISLVFKIINTIVNAIEKFTSLLSWVDYRKTLILMILLFIVSGVASTLLLKGIFMILSIHRLVKAKQFYTLKHYVNNRRFAVYSIRYIINKSFPQLIPKGVDLKKMNFQQLNEALQKISFPICDSNLAQQLKVQMDQIVTVYLDVEGIAQQYKGKSLIIRDLLDMVESCQSRLKLKWIPGKQGISNQFQELKQLTKQDPVMDVWLQSLLINFILNTPSKLYRALFPKKTK